MYILDDHKNLVPRGIPVPFVFGNANEDDILKQETLAKSSYYIGYF